MLQPRARAADSEKETAALLRKQTPTLTNLVAVNTLTATLRFNYRARVFDLPPVSFVDGLALQRVELELRRMGDEPESDPEGLILKKLRFILMDALEIMHRSVRPVTLFDRLTWRWRDNPFRDASRREVAELLSFFSACRTLSGVRGVRLK